ncbi:Aste57867_8651 [Aphanomyces stellatus]|uniref:Aste57867_8651 protein n=1 Tax=Aphanomyces stellatus TaxID=120398 RepID=A0A485KL18_9STRA|nr:hypothetical protein As57867_008617 [Aphanomyces stellatus]VFT85537.1 Aste57867_8651 [Aphanomyces stellatus]
MLDDDLDMAILTRLETKLTQREAQMDYLRRYRVEKKSEMRALKTAKADLEALLTQLQANVRARKRGMLPWKDVACALKDARGVSETDNTTLRRQASKMQALRWHMEHWVLSQMATSSSSLHASRMTHARSWRHTTLVAHPEARLLGMQWLMQQMYCNMDHLFAENGFPDMLSRELINDCTFEYREGRRVMVRRQEFLVDASIGHMRTRVGGNMLAWLNQNRSPAVPTETLHTSRDGARHAKTHQAHFVTKEYAESSDRVVYFVLNVTAEGESESPLHRSGHYVFQALSANVTKIRLLYLCTDAADVPLTTLVRADRMEDVHVPKAGASKVYCPEDAIEATVNTRMRREAVDIMQNAQVQWMWALRGLAYRQSE